jgi:hypothetical protein
MTRQQGAEGATAGWRRVQVGNWEGSEPSPAISSFAPRTRWLDPTIVLVLFIPSREFIRNQDEDGGIPPPSSSSASLSHDTRPPGPTPVGIHTLTNHGHARRARWREFLESTLDVERSPSLIHILVPFIT